MQSCSVTFTMCLVASTVATSDAEQSLKCFYIYFILKTISYVFHGSLLVTVGIFILWFVVWLSCRSYSASCPSVCLFVSQSLHTSVLYGLVIQKGIEKVKIGTHVPRE